MQEIHSTPLCAACGRRPRALSHAYCTHCRTLSVRVSRSRKPPTEDQRRKSNCRSYLHVYVKRGKIAKGPCEVCGSLKVEAHHDDYSQPLKVRWLCRVHRLELRGQVAERSM